MRKTIVRYLYPLITWLIFSCNSDDPQISVTVQNGPPGVYVGGYGPEGAIFWKDGVASPLLGGSGPRAEHIFVNGNDIYFAGKTTLLNGNVYSLVYWKNGSIKTIQDLSSENAFAQLKGFTFSGNDLHAVWNENTGPYTIIKYWKNGNITSITAANHYATATSLVVYGNDVYISGYESEGSFTVAKYWKNGKAFSLTDGKTNARASSIFIHKGNVYVAGMEDTSPDISINIMVAKYWKNGVVTNLPNEKKNTTTNSIFVDDSGIYVAGTEYGSPYSVAKYWKDGVATSLTDGTIHGSSSQIIISNNDIYVVGKDGPYPTIWKNGSRLAPFDVNDPAVAPLCITVLK